MHNPQILSSQSTSPASSEQTTPQTASAPPVLIFDACHLGVVLRAVLGVELTLAIAALYTSADAQDWLLHMAWLTSGGLPGTLVWLLLACSLKRVLHRMDAPLQYASGVGLGVGAGLYASAMLTISGEITALHWLANAIVGGLFAAVLVGYLVLRAEGRTPAATTAQLTALQAHIRPHFLFNALNSAVALVREQPSKAEQLLTDLSDLFRATLRNPRSTISLQEEIELAQRYLDIEQVRFGDRLQVEWLLDPAALHARLPPLLLQPLVENAVKHGVEPSEIGTKVTISAQLTRKKFILLTVTNTRPQEEHRGDRAASRLGQGMALANVERRLRLLHDVQATFSAGPKDRVFEVKILLPSS
ncbi:MAG: histidine kinase [Comamonadaceae bacterium]|nr:histidine kinase [Comamonadaceae bacterium]